MMACTSLRGPACPSTRLSTPFCPDNRQRRLRKAFPVLNLEQVYGAITHYLSHRDEVDHYLGGRQQDFEAARQAARDADPMFYQKLTDAKKHTPLTR